MKKIKGQKSCVLYSITDWEIKQLASLHFLYISWIMVTQYGIINKVMVHAFDVSNKIVPVSLLFTLLTFIKCHDSPIKGGIAHFHAAVDQTA